MAGRIAHLARGRAGVRSLASFVRARAAPPRWPRDRVRRPGPPTQDGRAASTTTRRREQQQRDDARDDPARFAMRDTVAEIVHHSRHLRSCRHGKNAPDADHRFVQSARDRQARGKDYDIWRLDALARVGDVARWPFSIRILLENLLRREDGKSVFPEHIEAVAKVGSPGGPDAGDQFTPARALLQDFTGVPAVCDLAAMREALNCSAATRARSTRSSLLTSSSTTACRSTTSAPCAASRTTCPRVRAQPGAYQFLRWGQSAFENFRVVPPGPASCTR